MVRRGYFTVQLVAADNEEVFREHTAKNGDIFVEVEPNVEYFIYVENHSSTSACFEFIVDGKNLGYYCYRTKDSALNGLWSRNNDIETETALKFTNLNQHGSMLINHSTYPKQIGSIVVKVYEHKYLGTTCKKLDFISSWGCEDSINLISCSETKGKSLKSKKGDVSKTKRVELTEEASKVGTLLDTIKLNYCTALGLVQSQILPPTPMWNFWRRVKPCKKEEYQKINIEPKFVTITTTNNNCRTRDEKRYEEFDLTNINFSDDESENEVQVIKVKGAISDDNAGENKVKRRKVAREGDFLNFLQ